MPTIQPSYVSVWTSSDYQSYPTITLDPSFSHRHPQTTMSAGLNGKKNKKLFAKHLNRYMQIYNHQLRSQSSILKSDSTTTAPESLKLLHAIIDENHQRLAKKREIKVKNQINNQFVNTNSSNSFCLYEKDYVDESISKLVQKFPTI